MKKITIKDIKPYEKNPKKCVRCYMCGFKFYGIRDRKDRVCKKCVSNKLKEKYYNNKEEIKERTKKYREKNKEIIIIKKRLEYLKNRKIILEIAKKYYQENKEKIAIYSKAYRQNNIEKILIKNRNRKNKLRASSKNSDIDNKYLLEILEKSIKCPLCKNLYKNKTDKHIDHIIPISIGGEHKKSNIRVICKKCNLTRPKDGRDIIKKIK